MHTWVVGTRESGAVGAVGNVLTEGSAAGDRLAGDRLAAANIAGRARRRDLEKNYGGDRRRSDCTPELGAASTDHHVDSLTCLVGVDP